MLAALIIAFREAFEVGLIVGIVMFATRGIARRNFWLTAAVAVGLVATGLFAAIVSALADLFRAQQDIFNAVMLILAVIMLTWHVMVIRRHSDQDQPMISATAKTAAAGRRTIVSLSIVVATAVVREGFELVMMLYGVRVLAPDKEMFAGAALGIVLATALTAAMYRGLMKVPTRALFVWSSRVLVLFTAGLASQAVVKLQHAGVLTWGQMVAWDSKWILPVNNVIGETAHVLFGYSDAPTVLQLVTYVLMLVVIFTLRQPPLVTSHSAQNHVQNM
jgi:high-affinity iron transporter